MGKAPKITPERINKQSGGPGYRLYRVFEVYAKNTTYSMLFNVKADAEAVADWHNETRSLLEIAMFRQYKVRERRVHSGIHHCQTVHDTGLVRGFAGAE